MLKPSLIVAQVQIARAEVYKRANPSGFSYLKSVASTWVSGASDADNAKNMLNAIDYALAAMYRQLPAAEAGDPKAMRIFATTVKNILPTIRNFLSQPGLLSRFTDEVLVGTAKDAVDPVKPWLYLASAIGVAYVVRTVWMVK